ncbi:MAG: hypothetical protein IPN15_15785 [Saprospiraceae bacterium]|nr:hypothetical protein [Candidatus Vicinibacter affinis]
MGQKLQELRVIMGKLIVKYSTIKDFGVGIDKELNGGIGIGLILSNNHILGDYISVRNTSSALQQQRITLKVK